MDIIQERHSIRKYTDKQIRREDLEKILEAYVGKLNMAHFDRSHLAGSFVSKEQPSTIDDPTIKNGFYDAPTVICVFCQNHFIFRTADAFCMMEKLGYIDGEQPKSKPRKPGRIKIIE